MQLFTSTSHALGSALLLGGILASTYAQADGVKTVFVISMENKNWTQPAKKFTGIQQQIYGNPAAPFINDLVNGTLTTEVNDRTITSQTAYAVAYHNVRSTPTGPGGTGVHPSEPNYIWAEAGTNFDVHTNNPPYGPNGNNQNTTQHLSTLLTNSGKTWKSYQEDIDLAGSGENKTNTVLPQDQWTVPLTDIFGTSTTTLVAQNQWTVPLTDFLGISTPYINPYNGSHQYDYATKHNPMLFFSDTNGGNNITPSNPMSSHYAPLQQLQIDLDNNTVADYNWITPNEINDMHSNLSDGNFDYNGTIFKSGAALIAQGDNFLSMLIPIIMASQAYQNNGAIIIWWDESESDGVGRQDDYKHTIGEIVISRLAAPNVDGRPFASTVNLTHSDDLRTMQNIFGVNPANGYPYLEAAANAQGLDSLFAPGAVAPEPEP